MDEERFDTLTRRWGTALRSRRALARLLAGGGVATVLGRILPQDRTDATAGKRRRSHPSAAEADPRVVGVACRTAQPKGPVRGESCGLRPRRVAKAHPPHGCCPGSSCLRRKKPSSVLVPVKGNLKGSCYCDDGYELDETTDGFCRKIPPRPCVGLNVACNALDVCCDQDSPSVDCAIVEPQKGRTRCDTTVGAYVAQCCVVAGTACSSDCACCGDLRCQNGVCAPPPAVCHATGESCDDGEPCCPGAGQCRNGRCCLADGETCLGRCEAEANCSTCCAGYCRADRRCGPPQGCLEYGGFCSTDAECCNDVPCTGGRCRLP